MNFKAVIFDMDGVLIDSELYWEEEGKSFFGKRGIEFTPALMAKLAGNSMRANVEWAKYEFGFPESVEELCKERVDLSEPIYKQKSGIMPGVETLLRTLKINGRKTAIASGSFLYRIETIVNRFGWNAFFDTLVSTDHVNYVGKPKPDIYIYTGKTLAIDPAECVVIEDSVNGVRAAKAAGMSCIAVPDPRWSFGDFSEADIIIDSLLDPKLRVFLGIQSSVTI